MLLHIFTSALYEGKKTEKETNDKPLIITNLSPLSTV